MIYRKYGQLLCYQLSDGFTSAKYVKLAKYSIYIFVYVPSEFLILSVLSHKVIHTHQLYINIFYIMMIL